MFFVDWVIKSLGVKDAACNQKSQQPKIRNPNTLLMGLSPDTTTLKDAELNIEDL